MSPTSSEQLWAAMIEMAMGDPVDLDLERRLSSASNASLVLGPDPRILLDTWVSLYSIAQGLLIFLIATLILRRREAHGRGWMLINMLFTMLLDTIANCLLYYAGQSLNPNPPQGICLAQATVKHGTASMIIAAEFSVALQIFLSAFRSVRFVDSSGPRWVTILLLVLPYTTALTWGLPVAIMGIIQPLGIERLLQSYYCSYNNNLYGNVSTIFGVVFIFTTAGLLTATVVIIHRSWASMRKVPSSGPIDVSLIVRLGVFVFLQIVYITLTIVGVPLSIPGSLRNRIDDAAAIFEALTPTLCFAVFGLQKPLIKVWLSWFKFVISGGRSRSDTQFGFSSLEFPDMAETATRSNGSGFRPSESVRFGSVSSSASGGGERQGEGQGGSGTLVHSEDMV